MATLASYVGAAGAQQVLKCCQVVHYTTRLTLKTAEVLSILSVLSTLASPSLKPLMSTKLCHTLLY